MIKFTVVDAFTRTPFQGNQAAVFVLKDKLSEESMQKIAFELNLSESVFLNKIESEKNSYSIRWFTPQIEVDICGHATLAAAHTLWEEGHLGHGDAIQFHSQEHGMLEVKKRDSYICMNFPSFAMEELQEIPSELRTMFPGVLFAGITHDTFYVELEAGEQVEEFEPDYTALKKLKYGLIITAKSHRPQVDFVNRCFFPKAGIDEDPVTGSAYSSLAPYWMEKLNLSSVMGEQLSQRTGRVHVEKADGERLTISGQAASTYKGIFTTPLC